MRTPERKKFGARSGETPVDELTELANGMLATLREHHPECRRLDLVLVVNDRTLQRVGIGGQYPGAMDHDDSMSRMAHVLAHALGRIAQIYPDLIPTIRELALRWAGH